MSSPQEVSVPQSQAIVRPESGVEAETSPLRVSLSDPEPEHRREPEAEHLGQHDSQSTPEPPASPELAEQAHPEQPPEQSAQEDSSAEHLHAVLVEEKKEAEEAPPSAHLAGKPPRLLAMPVPVLPVTLDWERAPGGWVEARVTIDESGAVVAVEAGAATTPGLIEPTLRALRKARYEPVKTPAGKPVQVDFLERITF